MSRVTWKNQDRSIKSVSKIDWKSQERSIKSVSKVPWKNKNVASKAFEQLLGKTKSVASKAFQKLRENVNRVASRVFWHAGERTLLALRTPHPMQKTATNHRGYPIISGQWLRSQTPPGYWDIPISSNIQRPQHLLMLDLENMKVKQVRHAWNQSKRTLQHPCWCLKFWKQYLKPEPWAFGVTGMLQTFLRPPLFLLFGMEFAKISTLDFVNP